MKTKTTIKLWSDGHQWNATSNDTERKALFGTDTLPTAFLASAPAKQVIAEIQKRNPQAKVSLTSFHV